MSSTVVTAGPKMWRERLFYFQKKGQKYACISDTKWGEMCDKNKQKSSESPDFVWFTWEIRRQGT
jgi:hypothetical protein